MNFFHDDNRYQFLAEFAYNGAHFYGVQEQKNLKTVLGALRQRVLNACGQSPACLFVAARTDRGVHALHNVATFYVRPPLDINLFIEQVQKQEDDGLLGLSIKHVDKKVHARSGRGKIYRYTIYDGLGFADQQPFPYAWAVAPFLDKNRMQEAAYHMAGMKDFSSLRGGGCQAGTAVKEIYRISVKRMASGVVTIEVVGNAFVRKMIRNMVGLLVEVGAGFRPPTSIPAILAAKDRKVAGIMAPAHGLMLVRVLM